MTKSSKFTRTLAQNHLPQSWETVTPHHEGYCYLHLYEEALHQNVANILGVYPTWRSVKLLGGMKTGQSYFVTRTTNDSVHIEPSSIGSTIQHLRIADNDYLGGSCGLKSHGAPVIADRDSHFKWLLPALVGRGIQLIWLLPAFVGRGIQFIWLLLKFCFCRLQLPNPAYKLEKLSIHMDGLKTKEPHSVELETLPHGLGSVILNKQYKSEPIPAYKLEKLSIHMDGFKTKEPPSVELETLPYGLGSVRLNKQYKSNYKRITQTAVIWLALTGLPIGQARLSNKAYVNWDELELSEKERKEIDQIHPKYVETFTKYGKTAEICTTSISVRHKVLDLDVDNDVMFKYIEAVCPQLRGISWWSIAEALDEVNHDKSVGSRTNRVVDVGMDTLAGAFEFADRQWATTKQFVNTVVEENPDAYSKILNKTKDVVGSTLSSLLSITQLAETATGELFEETYKLLANNTGTPAGMLGVAVSVVDLVEVNLLRQVNFTKMAIKNFTMSAVAFDDIDSNAEALGKVANLVALDAAKLLKDTYETVNMGLGAISGSCKTTAECEESTKLLFSKTKQSISEVYTTLKEGVTEVAPYDRIDELADSTKATMIKTGETVGGMISAAFGQAIPDIDAVAKARKTLIGEPVTSEERVMKSRYRPLTLADLMFRSMRMSRSEEDYFRSKVRDKGWTW